MSVDLLKWKQDDDGPIIVGTLKALEPEAYPLFFIRPDHVTGTVTMVGAVIPNHEDGAHYDSVEDAKQWAETFLCLFITLLDEARGSAKEGEA